MEKRTKLLNLIRLLSQNHSYLRFVSTLVDQSEFDHFAGALINMTLPCRQTLPLIYSLITHEFEQSIQFQGKSTVLRSNCVVSKVMGKYARIVGQDYVKGCIAEIVRQVVEDEQLNLEIDPRSLPDDAALLKHNQTLLLEKAQCFLERIIGNSVVETIPREIRAITGFIAELCHKHSPEQLHQLIGGFIMLRVFNPSIIAPESHALLPKGKIPSAKARRNLILVSKCLQNLSNDVQFGAKEEYMVCMNDFIEKNSERIKTFFNRISVDPLDLQEPFSDLKTTKMTKEEALSFYGLGTKDLNLIHRVLYNCRPKLLEVFSNDTDFIELINWLPPPTIIKTTTPLYQAWKEKNIEKMKALVREGTDIHSIIRDDPEWIPLLALMEAASTQLDGKKSLSCAELELCLLLIENGADVNVLDGGGRSYTPLQVFCRLSWRVEDFVIHLKVMSFLVAIGGINYQAKSGETALHLATIEGVAECVQYLIKNGAAVNIKNNRGDTCLHYAVVTGKLTIISYLLNSGADPEIIGQRGKNCYELTENPKVQKILNENRLKFRLKRSNSTSSKTTVPLVVSKAMQISQNEWQKHEKALIIIQTAVRKWLARKKFIPMYLKLQKEKLLCNKKAKRILDSERSYVADLLLLVQNKDDRGKKKVALAPELTNLLQTVEPICAGHKAILTNLEEFFIDLESPQTLGSIFVEIAEHLNSYGAYLDALFISQQKQNPSNTHHKFTNHHFSSFMKDKHNPLRFDSVETRKSSFISDDLRILLASPQERAFAYEELLKDVLDSVPRQFAIYHELFDALQEIKAVSERLRSRMSNRHKISEFMQHVIGKEVAHEQVYIHEGDLQIIHQDGSRIPHHFFLFNDLFLCTKAKNKKSTKIMSGPLYEFLFELALTSVFVMDVPNIFGLTYAFQVVNIDEKKASSSILLAASSEQDKTEWLKCLPNTKSKIV